MKLLLRGAPKNKLTIDLKNELDSLTGTYVPIPLPSVSLTNIAVTGLFDLMKGGLAAVQLVVDEMLNFASNSKCHSFTLSAEVSDVRLASST